MVTQILIGIMLAWMYNNVFFFSWFSVYCVMLNYEFGWILRSFHIVFTSFIYFLLFAHIIKVFWYLLMFDSSPIVMMIGVLIFIDCILIAFIGYVLPLTQMSYWGLTVFSNILSTVPIWGEFLVYWLWGSEFISEGTLVKMHTLHIVLPFTLLMIMVLHLFFLHYFLSSDSLDRFTFYIERCFFMYYYYFRDIVLVLGLLWIWFYLIFIYWYFVFHEESWVIVEVLKTSEKVIPKRGEKATVISFVDRWIWRWTMNPEVGFGERERRGQVLRVREESRLSSRCSFLSTIVSVILHKFCKFIKKRMLYKFHV